MGRWFLSDIALFSHRCNCNFLVNCRCLRNQQVSHFKSAFKAVCLLLINYAMANYLMVHHNIYVLIKKTLYYVCKHKVALNIRVLTYICIYSMCVLSYRVVILVAVFSLGVQTHTNTHIHNTLTGRQYTWNIYKWHTVKCTIKFVRSTFHVFRIPIFRSCFV